MTDERDPDNANEWWEDREVVLEIDPYRSASPVTIGLRRVMGNTSSAASIGASWTEAKALHEALGAFLATHERA
jgi:hypothetical protein